MKLSALASTGNVSLATLYPNFAYALNPPAGSPWDQVLNAWDGSYTDLISVPALGIASYLPTVTALRKSGLVDIGDNLSAGSAPAYSGPVALTSISTLSPDKKYIWSFMPDAQGNLVKQVKSAQLGAFDYLVLAGIAIGTAGIASELAAGVTAGTAAGAVGAPSLSSADVAAIYGDAGYGGVGAVLPSSPVLASVGAASSLTPSLGSSALTAAGTAASSLPSLSTILGAGTSIARLVNGQNAQQAAQQYQSSQSAPTGINTGMLAVFALGAILLMNKGHHDA